MTKKNNIEKEYESLEKDIHMMADNEIKNIEKKVNKIKKEAEKIGEEVEISMTEKSVKSKNSSKPIRELVSKRRRVA
jgi:predicted NACHT family NTPase